MAISKEILNNKKKKTNQPEPLGTVPANNPDHVSAPVDFHHPIPPKPVLHNSFAEAVGACEQIFLKPGEAHTEFYQEGGIIHCVVGIGNYNPGYKHLYLTDTGSNMSIDERLSDMANQINTLNNTVEVYVEDVNGLKKDVSILNRNIAEFENNINHVLDNIRRDIEAFEETVNEQLENATAQITELSEQVEDISNYVNGFDERIQQNTDNIADLSTRVVEIENWKPEVDTSINRLEDLINGFEPIDTFSIRSLFHDDIYTVNLCCYTAGGHVEIFDDVAGEKWGGDSSRVAECTPFNEYKTYVKGDNVSFLAVPNEGYKFVRWYINGEQNIEELSIDTSFGSAALNPDKVTDIPVIGTLANGIEPGILEYGYTAVFEKLHRLTVSVICETNDPSISPAFGNDRLVIKVNDVEVSYEEALKGKVYFDRHSKVEITAIPDEDGHHEFTRFIVRENPASAQVVDTSTYVDGDVDSDLIVEAYFMEYWIYVHADANPTEYGDVTCPTGADRAYINGSDVYMYAEATDEDWSFDKWTDETGDPDTYAQYITPGVTSNEITLHVTKDVDSYHLTARFISGEPPVEQSFTRENANGFSENRRYIFAAPTSDSTTANPNVAVTKEYVNSSSFIITHGTKVEYKADESFNDLTAIEFTDGTVLSNFIGFEYAKEEDDITYYYMKDLSDTEKPYLTSTSANKFGTKGADPQNASDSWLWTVSFNENGLAIIKNKQTERVVQYNQSSPRFAPYVENNQTNIALFYVNLANNTGNGLLFSISNKKFYASNTQPLDPGEDE